MALEREVILDVAQPAERQRDELAVLLSASLARLVVRVFRSLGALAGDLLGSPLQPSKLDCDEFARWDDVLTD